MPDEEGSVIIAAHNEGTVLSACLAALVEAEPDAVEVVVAANGCTDDTAAVARSHSGVRVVELPHPGKTAALNAAEHEARTFPRAYLDADILLTLAQLRILFDALSPTSETGGRGQVLAAVPKRRVDARGRPLLVRAYIAINTRHPAFASGLFGRGLVVVSQDGRGRFTTFPEVMADDLFLDSLFTTDEKREVPQVEVVVKAPYTTRDLLRRLERVRRGNRTLRHERAGREGSAVAPQRTWSWLTAVVLPRPWLAPAAVVYIALTLVAELRARVGRGAGWGHDLSTRHTEKAAVRPIQPDEPAEPAGSGPTAAPTTPSA